MVSEAYMDSHFRWILHGLAHAYRGGQKKGGGAGQLAKDLGVSFSVLSRRVDPNESECPRFYPAESLPQFCKRVKSVDPMRYLAREVGHILTPVPKGKTGTRNGLLEIHKSAGECLKALHDFYEQDGDPDQALRAIDALMREAASHRITVKEKNSRQLTLLDGEMNP